VQFRGFSYPASEKQNEQRAERSILEEAVRFELTEPCDPPVFKTGALNRSATLPEIHQFGPLRRTSPAGV
jgi:hypothetical protein